MGKGKGACALLDYVLLWAAIAAIYLEYGFVAAVAVPAMVWCILRIEKKEG